MSRTYRRKGQRMYWDNSWRTLSRYKYPEDYEERLRNFHRDWKNRDGYRMFYWPYDKLWDNRKLRRQLSLETLREEEEAHEDRYMEWEWATGLLASHEEA